MDESSGEMPGGCNCPESFNTNRGTWGAAEQLTLLLDGNDNFHVFWQESYPARHPRQTAHPGNREGAPWLAAKAGKSSAATRNSGLRRQQQEKRNV